MGNTDSVNHRGRKSLWKRSTGEKVWYKQGQDFDMVFYGCPYCEKKMSQSRAEECVFRHMLAYYRYKVMGKLRKDPDFWLAEWGCVLPNDPLWEHRWLTKFSPVYWERENMSKLMEKVDTNRYDLSTAEAAWSNFRADWEKERIGEFPKYRAEFRQFLKTLQVTKSGDRVYAYDIRVQERSREITPSNFLLATVQNIDFTRNRIQIRFDFDSNSVWMPMHREGRDYLKPLLVVSPVHTPLVDPTEFPLEEKELAGAIPNDERQLQVDVMDCHGKWYQAEIREFRDDQVLIHYDGWPDRYDEWIVSDSDRIEPLFARTAPDVFHAIQCGRAAIRKAAPEPTFKPTLFPHVVADLLEFIDQNHINCEDCKEPMTTQTFHLTRCFHMICKLCNHARGERCFCGHPFADTMAIPKDFLNTLAHFGKLAKWECVVCMEPMTDKNFHLTSCLHKVCKSCLHEIKTRHNPSCPLCRQEINS
jgi:hypothetical protein